jgi:hypothetical protein
VENGMSAGGAPGGRRQARNLVRLALVLLAGFLGGERLVAAVTDWRQWHQLAVVDPSAADLYRTNFWFDIATVGAAIVAAWIVNLILQPPGDP